ncbi:endopeptidase La [Tumebacillus permanentifrigoris]|uniref:Lon protease n=1 Tax=Tumebacillus permanentifrigoris TaxID=378543 RepID=A0A316DCW4_9BACL|nr:endopeptidase La [Tumebacillus permanentifrigoris]PWK15834.1 ATP-dependent Lon protease [Tumebacillus permanentifrigoris]
MGITRTKRKLPLLPLRGLLIYPTMVMHLDVGREKSVKALEKAMVGDNLILLVSQVETHIDDPEPDEIFELGTVARVKQMLKLPNGTMRVLIEGIHRAKILEYLDSEEFYLVEVEELPEQDEHDPEVDALMRAILHQFEQYIKISKKITQETLAAVTDIDDPGRLADAIASHLTLKIKDKQVILEAVDVKERLEKLLKILSDEREVIELERKINQRVRKQMEKTQKEYYLREQLKAIQKELGDKEGRAGEADELREQLAAKQLPEEVHSKVEKEIDRLEKMPSTSAEGSVIRTYIDWVLALPWSENSESEIDIKRAEEVLDEEHYGLDKVKERILEYLAVQALVKKLKGPILCLAGPPGVGKTSLARSIAKALGRKFVRVSLGGVRDEAEIRGHRRTYVGAMPGRIIQGMKSAGQSDPLFLLDEIDKMTSDFRGDPSSALLEVLDPEQNATFSDHYIEMPYDLSNVMFITTANVLHNIPGPLMDRMEVINLSGYTEVEKLHIAKNHLLNKQIENHGLQPEQVEIDDETLYKLIRGYTREAGVRSLERQLAALCRKSAKLVVSGEAEKVVITPEKVEEFLGGERFRFGMAEKENQVGVVTGLAWTSVGGDTLSIEASTYAGKGKLTLTGQLGDVMKESAQAAFSYIRSRADELGIDPDFLDKNDIHLHIPEGAIPKDGPSAGISMATALVSALTGIPVRKEVAMTGEITLRGHVLPIGGLKEKSMSAHRAGITTILLPFDNKKDIEDIPESVRAELTLHPVEHMDQVLEYALTSKPKPNPKPAIATVQTEA